jgi:hypothetical protein
MRRACSDANLQPVKQYAAVHESGLGTLAPGVYGAMDRAKRAGT